MKYFHKGMRATDTFKISAVLLAAQERSFVKASEKLGYTPSALCHLADALEAELGLKVLERTHRGGCLTPEGQTLLPKLQAVLDAEQALKAGVRELLDRQACTLRIGTYSSIANHILPEAVKQYLDGNPHVRVSICVGDSLGDWLAKDLVDVVLDDVVAEPAYLQLPFAREAYFAVVPQGAFPGRDRVCREELYPYTYISVNESKTNRYFDRSAFQNVIPFSSVDDRSVLAMVQQGLGVAVLPALVLRQLPQGVRALALEPDIYRTLYASCIRDKSPAATGFVAFMQARCGQGRLSR